MRIISTTRTSRFVPSKIWRLDNQRKNFGVIAVIGIAGGFVMHRLFLKAGLAIIAGAALAAAVANAMEFLK